MRGTRIPTKYKEYRWSQTFSLVGLGELWDSVISETYKWRLPFAMVLESLHISSVSLTRKDVLPHYWTLRAAAQS